MKLNSKSSATTRPSRNRNRRHTRMHGDSVVYHYTTAFDLAEKLLEGSIGLFYGDEIRHGRERYAVPEEAAAAWCSSDPVIERASCAAYQLGLLGAPGLEKLHTLGQVFDLCRIVVHASSAPCSWDAWWTLCGVPSRLIGVFSQDERLENGSDPSNWWVSGNPISAAAWLSVQWWDPWRLEWIPIQRSSDRMIAELSFLLPAHLRSAPALPAPEARLAKEVRNSFWSLAHCGRSWEEHLARIDYEHLDFSYDWHLLDRVQFNRTLAGVRSLWRQAEALAGCGLAVFPVSELCEGFAGCRRTRLAAGTKDYVDRLWLRDTPGEHVGCTFGSQSDGLVGVWVAGTARQEILRGPTAIPPTRSIRPLAVANDADVLLLRTPRELQLRTGNLVRTQDGCLTLLGEGRWLCMDPAWHVPPPTCSVSIAAAPEWLLRAATRLPDDVHEDDLGGVAQFADSESCNRDCAALG